VLGYGAPNSGWCDPEGAFACVLPPLPSGPSPQAPTRILGAGHGSGCAVAPQLWGTQRAETLINLSKTSNAVLDCLELTDHSGCVEDHIDRSVRCQRDTYPFGAWAAVGIYAADSSNVTLRNLNIHGLAVAGVQAGRLTDWTVENVRLAANGLVGWDGDIDGDDLYAGRVAGSPSSVRVVRSIAVGNAGNQMKTGGPASIVNSLLVSNCGFFHNKPFGAALGPREGDHCRAGGAAVHFDLHGGASASLVNSTVVGHGDVLVSTECQWRACSGSERLTVANNVFLGAAEFMDPQDRTALLWDPSGLASGRIDYNVIHAVKINRCPVGAQDHCGDPRLLNPAFEVFDGHLQAASPAVDSGLAVGGAGGLVPADDLEGNPRPSGSGVDRGAYERPSGQPRGGPPSVRCVAAAAGFQPVIARGSWISIFGSDLSTLTRTWNWIDIVDNKGLLRQSRADQRTGARGDPHRTSDRNCHQPSGEQCERGSGVPGIRTRIVTPQVSSRPGCHLREAGKWVGCCL